MYKNNNELRAMSKHELEEHITTLRQELFTQRLNVSTAHIKDYSVFKKIRKAIAQALTHATQYTNNNKNIS